MDSPKEPLDESLVGSGEGAQWHCLSVLRREGGSHGGVEEHGPSDPPNKPETEVLGPESLSFSSATPPLCPNDI